MSDPASVHDVVVPHGDVPLAVRVHRPATSSGDPARVVVCTGSWLTVKEQMPDLYAARLAARGLTAVTFDFSGFGASGGGLRQTEVPVRKVADLAAVAGWFHDTASVAAFYGGEAGVADRLARADRATARYLADGDLSLAPAYGADDDRAGMSLPMDYYADPGRGAVPQWRNEMSELSWRHWLEYDAFAAAGSVTTPTVLVHSDAAVLPDNVRRLAGLLPTVETTWLDGEQTDFYDRPEQVDAAVERAVGHFERLGA